MCNVGGRLHIPQTRNSINTITLDLENIKEFNCIVINNLFFPRREIDDDGTGHRPYSLECADIINLITSI